MATKAATDRASDVWRTQRGGSPREGEAAKIEAVRGIDPPPATVEKT